MNEGESEQVEIRLTEVASSDLTFTLDYVPGGSAQEGDYRLSPTLIVIGAGADRVTVAVTAVDDSVTEGEEIFMLRLNTVSAGVAIAPTNSITVTISENDQPEIVSGVEVLTATLSRDSVTLSEGGSVALEIVLTEVASSDLTFTLTQISGIAQLDSDYGLSLNPLEIVIGAGADMVEVEVTVVDDRDVEGEENFVLELNVVSRGVAIAPTGSIRVTIIDNDEEPPVVVDVTATLSVESVTLNEGESEQVEIRLTEVASSDLTFTLDYVPGGSAQEGDYRLSPTLIVIGAGADRVTVAVTAVDDSVTEGEEIFMLRLNTVSAGVAIAPTNSITVTISENDQPEIVSGVEVLTATLSRDSVTLSEGGSVALEIVLTEVASSDLTFTLTQISGIAQLGSDYGLSLNPLEIVIGAGADMVEVEVTVVDDRDVEGEENFVLELNVVSRGVAIAPTGSIRVTIIDNDEEPPVVVDVTATLSVESVMLNEGESEQVEIRLTEVASSDLTFTLDYVPGGSAQEGDYRLSPTLIVIGAGADSVTVAVTAVDDSVTEGEEIFMLRLNTVSAGVAIAPTNSITVTISANDQPEIVSGVEVLTATLSRDSVTLSEGGSVALEIVLTEVASSDLTFTLDYVPGGSAQEGDYRLSPTLIVIGAGADRVTVAVTAVDDSVTEGEEIFMLRLNVVSRGVAIAPIGSIRVTISENDQPEIVSGVEVLTATLSRDSVTLSEGGSVALEIVLTEVASSDLTFTLDYVPGGSAQEGDYRLSPTLIVIGAGADRVTVAVTAVDDSVTEGEEIFMLRLNVVSRGVAIAPIGSIRVTIIDDDAVLPPPVPVVIGFDPVSYSVIEATVTLELRVDVSGTLLEDVTLNYATADVTAMTPEDYIAVSMGTLTLSAGATEGIIMIEVIGDSVEELTETFTVTLSAAGILPAGVMLTPTVATVTIIDDDAVLPPPVPVVIGFEPVTYSVIEATVTLELRVDVSGTLLEDVTLNYATADVTAMTPEDYIAVSMGTLTLAAGATEGIIMIEIIGDSVEELTETFRVTLSAAGILPAGVMLTPTVATVTIIDDDAVLPPPVPVVIGFEPVTYSVIEATVTLELRVDVSGMLLEDVTLNYATADVTAMAPEDYIAVSMGTLTLSAGATEGIIMIEIIGDSVEELTETFRVTLSAAGILPAGVMLTPTVATVTIIDDDAVLPPPVPVVIGFDPVTYSVIEATVTLELRVDVSGTLLEDVTLNYATADVTAMAPEDYIAVSMGTLTLAAGATEGIIMIEIIGDSVEELTETFSVTLSAAGILPAGVMLTPTVATVTIIDDDAVLPPPVPVVIGFEPVSYSVIEATVTLELRVDVSGTLLEDVTLNYATADVTAMTPEDYIAVSMGTLTLSAGATEGIIMIEIIGDSVEELTETFTVTLSAAGILPAGVMLTPTVATVTIIDDDAVLPPPPVPVVIGFEPVTYSVIEATVTLELRVDVSGTLLEDVTLNYATADVTAMAPEDYIAVSMGTLTLSAGATEGIIMIEIIGDSVEELTETFRVTLSAAGILPAGVMLTPAVATVTIIDDDAVLPPPVPVVIGFEPVSYSVIEATVTLELRVDVSGTLLEDVTLNYATADVTAMAPQDYIAVSMGTLTLAAGATEGIIMIQIIGDSVEELTETFTVTLSAAGILPAGVMLTPAVATVTIIDDDAVLSPPPPPPPEATHIEFVVVTATIDEGDVYEIELRLVDSMGNALSHSHDVVVTLEVVNSLATTLSADEYLLDGEHKFSTMVNIPANEITGMVLFKSVEDNADEPDEYITLRIAAVNEGLSWDTARMLRINVRDDDAVIGFDPDTYTVDEDSGTIELTVKVLAGRLTRAVTLIYETMDGGAIAGKDYALTTGTVTLSERITSATFTVPIINDSMVETDETFTVVLSSVSSLPFGVMLAPATATVTIIDDDAVIGFDPDTYTVNEDSGTIELTVKVLAGRLARAVTLIYKTMDGSTIAGEDYALTTGTVTLSERITSVTFTVPITDDGVAETDETFTVVLSSPPFGIMLAPATATVTIPDIADAIINPGDMGRFCDIHNSATDPQVCVTVNSMISTGPLALVIEYIGIRSQADSIIEMGLLPFDMTVLPKAPVWEIYFEDANGNRVQTLSNTVEVESTIPRDLVDVKVGDVSIGVLRAGSVDWITLPTGYDTVSSNYSFTVSIDSFSFFTLMVPQKLSIGVVHDDNVIVEGQNAVVTVSLSVVAQKTVTVQLTGLLMTGGDYADRNDYRLSTTNVVIPANSRESTFTLDAVLDSLAEGDERLVLQASAARLTSAQLRVTIQDLALEPLSSATIVEGDSTKIIVRLSNIATVPVRVSLARVGGTATSNDYRLSPASVVIPAGSREGVFTVMANYDDDVESADETLEFEATAEADGVQLNKVRSTVTIKDISISIEGIGTEIREGVNRVVTVRLSNPAINSIRVSLARVGGTAASDDYELSPASVVIPAGSREDMFTVMVNYDGDAESDETLVFEATAEADGVQLNKVRNTVTIKDISISIEGIGTEIREGVNRVVTVRLSNPAIDSIRVSLAQIGGTASIDDYTFPEYVDITAGDLMSTFDLRATLDNIPEGVLDRDDKLDGKEGLRLEARAEVLLPRPVNLNRARRTVTLLDTSVEIEGIRILDVGGSIKEIGGVRRIVEGTSITVRVTLSEAVPNTITVLLEDIEVGGTARDSDYTLLPGDNVIQPGDMTATFILTAIDDRRLESDESLELSIGRARLSLMILGYDDGLALPPTGGLALPVWLVGVLTLVGVLAVVVSLGGLLRRRRKPRVTM